MQTIIILSVLAFIFLSFLPFILVKSAKFVAKRFEVKWRELEEWFDNKY